VAPSFKLRPPPEFILPSSKLRRDVALCVPKRAAILLGGDVDKPLGTHRAAPQRRARDDHLDVLAR